MAVYKANKGLVRWVGTSKIKDTPIKIVEDQGLYTFEISWVNRNCSKYFPIDEVYREHF